MTKVRFKTKLSRKQKRNNILIFLAVFICSYVFALFFCFSINIFDDWTALETYLIALCLSFFVLSMLIVPILFAAIALGIQMGRARRILDDATFVSVQNIDYYRDNLKEINPALASLLIDLNIYGKTDIIATLLRMQNKEAICIRKPGGIRVTGNNTHELDNSETELLTLIHTGKLNNKTALSQWKQNRFREAEFWGYIKKKEDNTDINAMKYISIAVLSVFIALILWGVFLNSNFYEVHSAVDLLKAVACLLGVDLFVFMPSYLAAKKISYRSRGDVLWERTALGNETAEKIAGLLRFIHEFSLLSEAKKEQAVLWDDYLVYAIVLEENEKIVEEISRQCKIDIHSFDISLLHRKKQCK